MLETDIRDQYENKTPTSVSVFNTSNHTYGDIGSVFYLRSKKSYNGILDFNSKSGQFTIVDNNSHILFASDNTAQYINRTAFANADNPLEFNRLSNSLFQPPQFFSMNCCVPVCENDPICPEPESVGNDKEKKPGEFTKDPGVICPPIGVTDEPQSRNNTGFGIAILGSSNRLLPFNDTVIENYTRRTFFNASNGNVFGRQSIAATSFDTTRAQWSLSLGIDKLTGKLASRRYINTLTPTSFVTLVNNPFQNMPGSFTATSSKPQALPITLDATMQVRVDGLQFELINGAQVAATIVLDHTDVDLD